MPKQRERKECFIQSVVLNVAPLLVYCASKSDTVSTETSFGFPYLLKHRGHFNKKD